MNIYLNRVIKPTIYTFLLTFITIFTIAICFFLILAAVGGWFLFGWYLGISILDIVLYSVKLALIPSALVTIVALIIFLVKNRNLKSL
jgi:hypothetical protein